MTIESASPSRIRRLLAGVRTRVVVGSIVLLVVAFAVSVLATRQMLLLRVDEAIEREMAQEVEELRALAQGVDPATSQPFGDDVAALLTIFLERNVPARDEAFYTFIEGRPYKSSFDAPASVFTERDVIDVWTSVTTPTRQDVVTAEGETRVLITPLRSAAGAVLGTFVVASFPAGDQSDAEAVIRTLLLVALVIVALASAATWSLAGKVLRPVRDLTDAARTTGASDLTKRIPVNGDDELAELGHTFNDMLDRLDESFRSQRAFLDDVAHELRTPITIVRGHLEMLPDDPNGRAAAVALMTDELDRMGRYVGDLLTVARSAQPDFLRPGLVDVADLIDGVVERGRAMAARDWSRTDLPRAGQILTEADPDRLLQALLALATNAVQHTSEGDRIVVGADASADQIRMWVSDSGVGIEADQQARVFRRFSRGVHSTSTRPDGTGLGLAIVAAIARAHGGEVQLESSPGRGATFRIVIPRSITLEEVP